ncbi:MAG: NAD-dependent epimerase/dehydratase family protein, partial [Verrucomicrobiota bacterium]
PSHDLAASRPFDDFDVNAVGTLNLIEAARRACPESPFAHMSTNKVYGYKGKQVRDNIHSLDVAKFIAAFLEKPRIGEIYNLGGGRQNSCSILEAFAASEKLTRKKMQWEYVDKNREGDHICYISDLRKMREHYPSWKHTKSLADIFGEIVEAWKKRR